jgi:hypothetical protein
MKILKPGEPEVDAAAESFDKCREIIGGYVELVRCGKYTMLVDEDGLSKQLPLNTMAGIFSGRAIVGTAIILDAKEAKKVLD